MDNFVSILYAILGLFYIILLGRGKFQAFIFGVLTSLLYSFLSFKNSLWGSFALNFFYYVPIETMSLFKWYKNTNPKTKSVNKLKLKKSEFILYVFIAVIISLILSYILYIKHDKLPLIDSVITVFSILGAYLTLKRVIEQWIIWTIVNFLTVVMWFIVGNFSSIFVIVIWFIYLISGIVFYFQWRREIGDNLN